MAEFSADRDGEPRVIVRLACVDCECEMFQVYVGVEQARHRLWTRCAACAEAWRAVKAMQ